jgi:hypothetical protein
LVKIIKEVNFVNKFYLTIILFDNFCFINKISIKLVELMEDDPYKGTHYRGLLYAAVTDTGPKILCNLTRLDEDHTFPLSVQAFTLLGLGSGSRTAGTWMEYTYGPLPFPTGRPLNTMIFSFMVEGADSKDSRVKQAGRAAALIFIVTKQFDHYDKLRDFLNKNFLSN